MNAIIEVAHHAWSPNTGGSNFLQTTLRSLTELPVYRLLYQAENVEDDSSLDDVLVRLPYLTKSAVVKGFPENFMAANILAEDPNIEYASTSGTSGERLFLMRPTGWWWREYTAAYSNNSVLAEVTAGEYRKAVLTTPICSGQVCITKNPSYEDRTLGNLLYLNTVPSPHLWQEHDVRRIHYELHHFKPHIIDAHVTYLALLIEAWRELGLSTDLPSLRAITLSYDFVSEISYRAVCGYFKVPVFRLYGSTECGVLYLEEKDNSFRAFPHMWLCEFIPVPESDDLHELIVTSFKNELMPLVRYRTGDLVKCNEIEGVLQPARFCGRRRDAITLPTGFLLSDGCVDTAIFASGANLSTYQLELGPGRSARLKYTSVDGDAIPHEALKPFWEFLRARLDIDCDLSAIQVKSLVAEASGKFKRIVVI